MNRRGFIAGTIAVVGGLLGLKAKPEPEEMVFHNITGTIRLDPACDLACDAIGRGYAKWDPREEVWMVVGRDVQAGEMLWVLE